MRTTLVVRKNGYKYKYPVTLEITEDRIFFKKAPFGLKDEIKAMHGAKWHGFDKENPRKIWSVTHNLRNVFQLRALMGENVYEAFEQPLIEEIPDFPLKEILQPQQVDMVRRGLSRHFQIFSAEQGLGKSLVAISLAMLTPAPWWYVGPKSACESFQLELEKWKVPEGTFERLMTYQALEKLIRYKKFEIPNGIIYDESTAFKNATTNCAKTAQYVADSIREKTDNQGYVICLSGTVMAKEPGDVWGQAEVAFPGFLREGSYHAFEWRYRIMEESYDMEGKKFHKRVAWNEDEVGKLPERLEGLMTTYRKKDWLNLPPKKFRRVRLEPSKKVMRVAKALVNVAPKPAIALTWLRALSSGFQYLMEENGQRKCQACNSMGAGYDCPVCDNTGFVATKEKVTKTVRTPKEDALREEMKGHHRIIVPASFRGSIDRCQKIAHEEGFAVCRVDGRGWHSYDKDGNVIKKLHPMRWWKECPDPVAFVGNPGSCKYGLTLVEAKKMVFFDNDFSAENRLQMIDRFHRIGQTESPEVVDLIHLPVDERVLEILDTNRSLELLGLGELSELFAEVEEPHEETN